LASRLVPDFSTVPRFASRRSRVSTRVATISLNADRRAAFLSPA
jgi:hypothetical protein